MKKIILKTLLSLTLFSGILFNAPPVSGMEGEPVQISVIGYDDLYTVCTLDYGFDDSIVGWCLEDIQAMFYSSMTCFLKANALPTFDDNVATLVNRANAFDSFNNCTIRKSCALIQAGASDRAPGEGGAGCGGG